MSALTYLNNPEYIALQTNLETKISEAAKYNECTRVAFNKNKEFVTAWWEENISKIDMSNPDDFLLLSESAWDFGSGNRYLLKHLQGYTASEGVEPYVNQSGHREIKGTDKTLIGFSVFMDCEATEEQKETVAAFLLKTAKVAQVHDETYAFRGNTHQLEVSFQLTVNPNGSAVASYTTYSKVLHVMHEAETVLDMLNFLQKEYPSCSCVNHSSRSYEDNYDY